MKRLSLFVTVLTTAFVAATASAQTPAAGGAGQRAGGPPAPSNLQVMPKDIPRDQLLAQKGQ
jgi:hypothetical protein